jgi:ATP synthase protein I
VPAAPDGPNPTGPMTSAQATSVVLRAAVVPTVVVGLLAVLVGWLVKGPNGALGAALGAVVAVVFFAGGQWAIGKVVRGNPDTMMLGALVVYVVQILVLFVLIALLKDATWLDGKVFALTVVLCALAWVGTAGWVSSRTRVLYVEPVSSVTRDDVEADQ